MPEQLTRRKALGTLGAVSVGALLAACGASDDPVTSTDVTTSDGATATVQPQTGSATSVDDLFADASVCTLTAEETEGPYYFDVDAVRSDIREDREGTTLRVAIQVQDVAACEPIANAVVDIWHCDAAGIYSGFESASQGGPGGAGPTDEETYLRGVQVTDANGVVQFVTIYPGWYRGRTVHIHAKVHVDNATALTTQLYFDEDVTTTVYESEPYSSDTGRDTFNENDGIFDAANILTLSQDGDGYLGVITFGVNA
jgi:protocatechuate 3,4-dioxygenase beta subunit